YFSRELQAYKEHCGQMMRTLFTHLTKHFAEWGPPPEPWMASPRRLDKQFGSYLRAMGPSYEKRNEQTGPRIVADYIAGMTDDYALTCYRELVLPTPLRLSLTAHLPGSQAATFRDPPRPG
nr:hypothetical protein [bacterium]